MLSVKPEVVSTLVDCFEYLSNELNDAEARTLRSRARDMPAELVSKGFSYVIVLTASRGDLKVVELGLTSTSCQEIVKSARDRVRDRKLDIEDIGYALYGAILLFSLKKLGAIGEEKFSKLVERSLKDPILNQTAYTVMDWIKRLAEAYLERRRE
jgi:CRISPR type III-B/RAMP module-associated protein Cmr5